MTDKISFGDGDFEMTEELKKALSDFDFSKPDPDAGMTVDEIYKNMDDLQQKLKENREFRWERFNESDAEEKTLKIINYHCDEKER